MENRIGRNKEPPWFGFPLQGFFYVGQAGICWFQIWHNHFQQCESSVKGRDVSETTFSNVNHQRRTEMSVKLKFLNWKVSKRLTVLKVVTTLHLHAIRNLRVHMQPETSTKNKVGDKITAILSQLVPPPFFSQVAWFVSSDSSKSVQLSSALNLFTSCKECP